MLPRAPVLSVLSSVWDCKNLKIKTQTPMRPTLNSLLSRGSLGLRQHLWWSPGLTCRCQSAFALFWGSKPHCWAAPKSTEYFFIICSKLSPLYFPHMFKSTSPPQMFPIRHRVNCLNSTVGWDNRTLALWLTILQALEIIHKLSCSVST